MHPVRSRQIGGDQVADAPVSVGDLIDDKYRVDLVLGAGGMGMVVKAEHLKLEQPVALKFMLPEAADNADHVARFHREARAAVQLRSEHVARVLDLGETGDGTPFIVMEYLEGKDLATLLDERGRVALDEALELTLHTALGLAEAHAAGIVHRDIKPENLFLTHRPDGTAVLKILDFGISKSLTTCAGDALETVTGSLLGSPHYMSPEQMRLAREVDERTDIWALGAVLYTLLAGRSPFFADSLAELCGNVLHMPPHPLADDVPAAVATTINRCLEKQRSRRFNSVAEFVAALAPSCGARGQDALTRIESLLAASDYAPPANDPDASRRAVHSTTPTLEATRAGTHSPRTRKRQLALAAGLALISISAAAAIRFFWHTSAVAPAHNGANPPQPALIAVPTSSSRAAATAPSNDAAADEVTDLEPAPVAPQATPRSPRKKLRADPPPPAPAATASERAALDAGIDHDGIGKERNPPTIWVHPADRRH